MIARNIYNKTIELTQNEKKVLNNLLEFCHNYVAYNDELNKYIRYNSTPYMNNSFFIFQESRMNKDDYMIAFKRLLINGIIEKIWKFDSEEFLYRTIYDDYGNFLIKRDPSRFIKK